MHDTAHITGLFLLHDSNAIFTGCTAMDDKRLIADPGSGNMTSKAITLPVQFTAATEIVKSCFANSDILGMSRQLYQLLRFRFTSILLIGMDSRRDRDLGVVLY